MRWEQRRRYSIELYFILYLTALLLLLPEVRHTDSEYLEPLFYALVHSSFDLVPDKNPLVLRLSRSGNGWVISGGDSVNRIGILGNVNILDINCVPYQVKTEQSTVRYTRSAHNLAFSLVPDTLMRQIRFVLHPSQQSRIAPGSFRVLISVAAKPRLSLPPLPDDPLVQQFYQWLHRNTIILRDSVSFSLQFVSERSGAPPSPPPLSFAAAETQQTDTTVSTEPQPMPPIVIAPTPAPPPFTARAKAAVLHMLQGETWSNPIYLTGVEDARSLPSVAVDCKPAAYRDRIQHRFLDPSTLLISGPTPARDTLLLTLLLTSSERNHSVRLHFKVIPHKLPPPRVPQVMYPEIAYQFAPNFPPLVARNVRAVLRDATGIRYTSLGGAPFTFIPQQSDTNQIFTFERYVDNRRVGETIKIPVKPYPPPEILEIVPAGSAFIIRVRTFGSIKGIANRARLLTVSGEAQIQERYGDYISIKETQEHIQTFEVTPRSDPRSLTLQAIDQRGKRSAVFSLTTR